jgi:hypothetical protein
MASKSCSSPLILDAPLIDWLTLTSYDTLFLDFWEQKLRDVSRETFERKALQYVGRVGEHMGGTLFVGEAVQKGRRHFMVRISGYAADDLKEYAYKFVRSGSCDVTRIDLQITHEVSSQWSQWDLLNRMKRRGFSTGWVESKQNGKGYETVYIGSRQSERFTRVYIKSADDPRLLRFETEFKGLRAGKVARLLAKGERLGDFLRHEVEKTKDNKGLILMLSGVLAGYSAQSPRVVPDKSLDKTAQWLMRSCLPAFIRVVNAQTVLSENVAKAFMDAIKDADINA